MPRSGKPYSLMEGIAGLYILLVFSVTLYTRTGRVAGVLFAALFCLIGIKRLAPLAKSPLYLSLIALPLLGIHLFLVRALDYGAIYSISIALRQLSYYFIFPIVVGSMFICVRYFSRTTMSMTVLIGSCALVYCLSYWLTPIAPEERFITGNLEHVTVLVFVVGVRFVSNSLVKTVFLISYLFVSLATSSSQGVILATLSLMYIVLPYAINRLWIPCICLLPLVLPPSILIMSDLVMGIDANVNFRDVVWRDIILDFFGGQAPLGQLGIPVYHEFIELLERSDVQVWAGDWTNIGAHNFILQFVHSFGVFGFLFGMFVLIQLGLMARALIKSSGSIMCFLALIVTFSLNQSIEHLLNVYGTSLLFSVFLSDYLSKVTRPSGATSASVHPRGLASTQRGVVRVARRA